MFPGAASILKKTSVGMMRIDRLQQTGKYWILFSLLSLSQSIFSHFKQHWESGGSSAVIQQDTTWITRDVWTIHSHHWQNCKSVMNWPSETPGGERDFCRLETGDARLQNHPQARLLYASTRVRDKNKHTHTHTFSSSFPSLSFTSSYSLLFYRTTVFPFH